jgi:hypothetical protein
VRGVLYALRRRIGALLARKNISTEEWRFFRNSLRPTNTGWDLIRIGSIRDGGYLIPSDLSELIGCISPGVSNLVDFELALAKLDIPSAMYDGSIENLPIENSKFHFNRKFVGSPLNKDYVSLKTALQEFSSATKASLLLQMDIEGDELSAFHTLTSDDFDKFRIIVVEFHRVQDWTNRTVFRQLVKPVFDNLLQRFDLVHIHPNNCDGEFYFARNFFPRAIEITFHHKSRRISEAIPAKLPNNLDAPNTDDAPDVQLKF